MRFLKKCAALALSAVLAAGMMPLAVMADASGIGPRSGAGNGGSSTLDEMAAQMQDETNDPFAFRDDQSQAQAGIQSDAYPAKLDLRNVNGQNYVTHVKFQNPFGTCWGFSAIAAAETSILGSGLAAQDGYNADTMDLSEKHLVNFINVPIDIEGHSQYGEGTHYDSERTASERFMSGGVPFFATTMFASGMGPVMEDLGSEYEYHGINEWTDKRRMDGKWINFCYSADDDWSLPSDRRFYQSYALKESYMLPSPAGFNSNNEYEYNESATNAIKEQLMQKRGVEIAFCADASQPDEANKDQFISTNWAHYTYKQSRANHGVCIVGWDDDYPAANFNKYHQPPADGAWLVKNSWGSAEEQFPDRGTGNWGFVNEKGENTGYFWISYYDQSIKMVEALAFDKSNVEKEYLLDQYDFMPVTRVRSADVDGEASTANVFCTDSTVQLEQVSCQTAAPGTKVSYEVYVLEDDFTSPADGVKASSGSDEFAYGGFHKITLDKPVILQKGQHYSIVITQITSQGKYNVNVPVSDNEKVAKENGYSSWNVGVINPKESYMKVDGEWIDYSDTSIRRELTGENYEYSSMDNFPIKGYCTELGNISIKVVGNSTDELYVNGDSSLHPESAKLSARFTGDKDLMPGDPEFKWSTADGSEGMIDLKVNAEDSSICTVTARNTGKAYLTVSADGYGMRVIPVTVYLPESVMIKSLKPGKNRLQVNFDSAPTLAEGCQVAYRVKGASKWKYKDVKSSAKKVTLKGLKKGKRYQVKARVYMVNSYGEICYGEWSKTRTSKKVK